MDINLLSRTERLLGRETTNLVLSAKVILFGVGGVGSWCAEALIRMGIHHLTIVDNDTVSATNLNRQLMATTRTIGHPKVEVLRERLLEINPEADIVAIQQTYSEETAGEFFIENYNYVIDCIDSLKDKVALIMHASRLSKQKNDSPNSDDHLTLFSSMGAALRIDPTKVRVAEFWKVTNDTLARALRRKFKHINAKPAVKFQCVYSEELPMENKGTLPPDDTCDYKVQINGSLCHITAIFGMTLAGLVLQDINKRNK